MKKRITIVMMIFLMAFQSFLSVADVHQQHQKSRNHMAVDHDNHLDSQIAQTDMTKGIDQSVGADCNHCCHCHSPSFASSNRGRIANTKADNPNSALYINRYSDIALSPDLRPPIV